QITACLWGLTIVLRHYGGLRFIVDHTPAAALFDLAAVRRMVAISRDLIIRSLALMTAFAHFAAQGARVDEVALSANAILMQLFAISAFFLDGLATAVEQLSGRAVGARWRPAFERAIRLGLGWGFLIALGLSALLMVGGWVAIDVMTTNTQVRE